ncbi:MAG: cohesin domain-containing protein [Candidatus Poribacteria bacterium]
MLEKGFKNVFALKGGLHGWEDAGYPIEVGSIDDPVQIHFSDTSNSPDGTVSINVALNANRRPVSIISLEIGFEPNLLTNPKAIISPTIKSGTPTDRILSTNTPAEGVLKLDFKPASQTQVSLNAVIPDGIIATVTFDVTSAAKSGTEVNLTINLDAMDGKRRFFRTTGRNAKFIIESITAVNPILKMASTWGNVKRKLYCAVK